MENPISPSSFTRINPIIHINEPVMVTVSLGGEWTVIVKLHLLADDSVHRVQLRHILWIAVLLAPGRDVTLWTKVRYNVVYSDVVRYTFV